MKEITRRLWSLALGETAHVHQEVGLGRMERIGDARIISHARIDSKGFSFFGHF
jgi:hypothetical protein